MPYKNGEWRPNNPKQAAFLSLPAFGPDKIKEGFFGGGAGSGKSELLLMYAIVNGWHNQPGFKQVFMRRTIPEINREIVPRSKLLFDPLMAKYYKQEKFWQFPTEDQYGSDTIRDPKGGMIFFGHCEHEDDVHLYDGMEINLFTPDELTSFTEYIYQYIGFTRVRSANPALPSILRSSGMPGDIGHSFVKRYFVDPAPHGSKIILGKGNNRRIYIHSTYKDNKDGDPTYGQSLDALNEQERRAKLGDWSTYEGSVFNELRTKKYPNDPPNALHLISPFSIPPYWAKIVAIDWGYSAMCSVGFGAISPNKRLYVYDHKAFYGKKIEEWCKLIKPRIESDKPVKIVICHSAGQQRGEPHTIHEQVCTALDFPVELGEKDRIGGKILVHEYLRFTPLAQAPDASGVFDPALAQWILRNKGMQDYSEYVNSFSPAAEEDNLPKLQLFDTPEVRVISEALKAATYVTSDKNGKKKEDVAEFDGDDPYDMLRMMLHAVDIYVNVSQDQQRKITDQERIIKQLETTQDMTAFYRNMRKLESGERIQPVKLIHRRPHARSL